MTHKENIIVLHKSGDEVTETNYQGTVMFVHLNNSYNGGIQSCDNAVIRIPSYTPLDISKGDKVRIRDKELYIYSLSENLKGTTKHIKLLCR